MSYLEFIDNVKIDCKIYNNRMNKLKSISLVKFEITIRPIHIGLLSPYQSIQIIKKKLKNEIIS